MDEVEQNIVICQWREDQLFAKPKAEAKNRPLSRSKTPTFKMRPSTQHFLWQWVILHENEKSLPYQRLSPRFDIEAQGNSEIAYSFWSRRHWQITLFCDNRGSIIVLSFDHQICFFNIFGKRSDLPFFKKDRSQEGENRGFVYAWAEYYLYRGYRNFVYRVRREASLAGGRHVFDRNRKPCMKSLWQPGFAKPNTVRWHCAWADHYLCAVICRSRRGLVVANEKEENLHPMIISLTVIKGAMSSHLLSL